MNKLRSLTTIVLISFSLLTACTGESNRTPDLEEKPAVGLTPTETKNIEDQISEITKTFFQNVEKLDIDAAMNTFENNSDFKAITPDGMLVDYASFKKLNTDGFSQLASIKNTITKESINVLTEKHVLYTFVVKQDLNFKTGEKMVVENAAGSMLFVKLPTGWKATFYQQSDSEPVKQ